ncbi:hypothetical protein AB0F81_29415 [Actinoplanes sp. NPDC024001]|uniref:hypothetical protein n=1 Tax=Actinoplanes sp. NPDC024001 TaxID=3154598 RepID=UPI0033DB37C2
MQILFAHSTVGSHVATVHRDDGVVLQLPGNDRSHRVPHELACFATERCLRMPDGVFGSIAAGGVFPQMRLLSGKPRYDAAARSKRLLEANKRALGLAELIAGVVHRAVEEGDTGKVPALAREAWALLDSGAFPWSDEQVNEAVRDLLELAEEWDEQGTVRVTWPEQLVAAVPAPREAKKGRRRAERRH